VLFLGCVAYGLYLMMWAFQSAVLSVPLPDEQKAVYETRALVFLPLSVVMIGQGVLFFLVLGRRK
jgi:TRAP-type mannitol/chloroaromatic compound transport system permease large subunit